MTRRSKRLARQFELIQRRFPALAGFVRRMRSNRMMLIRLPIALLLVFGGVVSFLPVLGIWMLPLGLMLLALDVPFLQGPVSVLIIRWRRRIAVWRRCCGANTARIGNLPISPVSCADCPAYTSIRIVALAGS